MAISDILSMCLFSDVTLLPMGHKHWAKKKLIKKKKKKKKKKEEEEEEEKNMHF
jgi:uncharacterized membrane protein